MNLFSCNQPVKTECEKSTLNPQIPNFTIKDTTSFENKPESSEIIDAPFCSNFQLKTKVYEKDWWEDIFLVIKNQNKELIIPKTSQSVLHAEFVDLHPLKSIFFEIYEITHQGNGYYNLFTYTNDTLINILSVRAVDRNQERIGITSDSSFVMKNDRLQSDYLDLNGDNYLDLKLSGIGYVLEGDLVKDTNKLTSKNPIQLERQFLWNTDTHAFEELIDRRKGFWYYEQHEIDY